MILLLAYSHGATACIACSFGCTHNFLTEGTCANLHKYALVHVRSNHIRVPSSRSPTLAMFARPPVRSLFVLAATAVLIFLIFCFPSDCRPRRCQRVCPEEPWEYRSCNHSASDAGSGRSFHHLVDRTRRGQAAATDRRGIC